MTKKKSKQKYRKTTTKNLTEPPYPVEESLPRSMLGPGVKAQRCNCHSVSRDLLSVSSASRGREVVGKKGEKNRCCRPPSGLEVSGTMRSARISPPGKMSGLFSNVKSQLLSRHIWLAVAIHPCCAVPIPDFSPLPRICVWSGCL